MTTCVIESPGLHDTNDFRECFRAFRPSPRGRMAQWCKANIVNDQGRPYDHAAYPHLANPGGPCDAFDDMRVRTIALQWATRLGKTFFAQSALLYQADTSPCPMMFGSAVEKLGKEVAARTYAMIHSRPRLNKQLAKSKREQRQDLIEFKSCQIFVAWSRSVSTLADKNIKVGHAGEYDKWEHPATAKEAHPHKLFDDRFKDYQSVRKVIYESTPTIKGRSPIERRLHAGTMCRYHVPCPHCRSYQILEMGDGQAWGVKWDKAADGHSRPDIAYDTAHYVCRHCRERIVDHQRPWMMRRGVWCPDGCEVRSSAALAITEATIRTGEPHAWSGWKSADWVSGTPPRSPQDASYQLSSLYALSLGWGDIAKEFVTSNKNPQELRNFVNQWLGETWQIRGARHPWQELAKRLNGGYRAGNVPDEVGVLTVGIDVQEHHFVFVVVGWGVDDREYVITWGEIESWEELKRTVLARRYGGGELAPLPIALGGIDSGHRTDEVYGYCRELGDALRPTKGFDALEKPILASNLEGARSETRHALALRSGMHLWKFQKPYWQEEFQRRLDSFTAGQSGSLSLPIEACESQDFMAQITNNAPQPTEKGRIVWGKVHDADPDDLRDALVIARVVKQMWTRGNEQRVQLNHAARRKVQKPSSRPESPKANPLVPFSRPGGWIDGVK